MEMLGIDLGPSEFQARVLLLSYESSPKEGNIPPMATLTVLY